MGRPVARTSKKRKKNQQKDNENVRGNSLLDLPKWLQDLSENLVDERFPAHRDAPTSSFSHFPKEKQLRYLPADSDYEGSLHCTSSRKNGDLMTADQKVLSEGCESQHNHRYAVVVQDLATQWLQSYQCKTRTSEETKKSLMKFLEPTRKPKVIFTDKSPEFGRACEDLPWNHCTSTPHPPFRNKWN